MVRFVGKTAIIIYLRYSDFVKTLVCNVLRLSKIGEGVHFKMDFSCTLRGLVRTGPVSAPSEYLWHHFSRQLQT